MLNKKSKSNTIITIAIIWCVAMALLLILMATYNTPIADQYGFMGSIRDHGIIGYTVDMYTSWSGRLIQTLSLGPVYRIFGDFGAQVAFPIILFVLLGAAYTFVCSQLLRPREHRLAYSVLTGFLLAGGTLYTTACLFDIYLWLDAVVVYLFGIIAVVYNFGVALWLIRNIGHYKEHKIIIPIMLIITALLQTAGETSMIICLGWSFLALLATLFVKKWHQYRFALGLFFAVVLAGSLIMILSPGLWNRADYVATEVSLFELLVHRPLAAIKGLFLNNISVWQLALATVIGIIISRFLPEKVTSKQLKITAVVAVLVIISFVYIPAAIYFYGTRAVGIESRALAIPCLGMFLGYTVLVAVLAAYFAQKRPASAPVLAALGVILSVVSSFGFLDLNKTYLSAIITRGNLVATRDALIRQYQNGEIPTLDLPDAPIMINNSGATDFTSNGWVNVDWFYDTFINYYHLDPADVIVHGEPLVLPETKQDWYIETGRNLCTEGSILIYEKYYCHNL